MCMGRSYTNFNSIKVRLKQQELISLRTHKEYFNSIKVRLKLTLASRIIVPCTFQFHKGTIKTVAACTICATSPYFNSIKVRLKHPTALIECAIAQFQFHKGTIKTSNFALGSVNKLISIP